MGAPGERKREKGSSTADVVGAAVLSVILGGCLGAAMLIFKPVPTVHAVPKDGAPDAVYYFPGATNSDRAGDAEKARRVFASGAGVAVDETILNCLAQSLGAKADAGASKPDQPKPAPPNFALDADVPNFRIADGSLHIASKVNVAAFGVQFSVLVQARGTFSSGGSSIVFNPDRIYVGTLQIQRFPVLSNLVMRRLLLPRDIPGNLEDAWSHLSTASIDGSRLRLSP